MYDWTINIIINLCYLLMLDNSQDSFNKYYKLANYYKNILPHYHPIQSTHSLFIELLQSIMDSSIHANSIDSQKVIINPNPNKDKDELKHIQDNVELMRNRVQLLKNQLQKQKDVIDKHKSLTKEVVQQKIQYNKLYSIKKRDHNAINQEITSLRARNHSYREMHKNQMNNILKALYLVKLDDARQIKNASLQNRKSLEKHNQSQHMLQMQRKKQIQEQSQHAKKRYLEYYKQKLNSVYAEGQRNYEQTIAITEQRKKQLQVLQLQQMNLLDEINQVRARQMQAKKQYVAALSLSTKDVVKAVQQKQIQQQEQQSSRYREKTDMQSSQSQSLRYKETQFFTKSPHVSLMSTNNIKIPRTKVDQSKFQIILKELKRLDERQKSSSSPQPND